MEGPRTPCDCTRTDQHVHTLLLEHLNHISCLPAIHHSHRQKHMAERQGRCTATCITTHKQTHARACVRAAAEQSTHFEIRRQRAAVSNPSSHTIFPSQKSTCIYLHAHQCQRTSTVRPGIRSFASVLQLLPYAWRGQISIAENQQSYDNAR